MSGGSPWEGIASPTGRRACTAARTGRNAWACPRPKYRGVRQEPKAYACFEKPVPGHPASPAGVPDKHWGAPSAALSPRISQNRRKRVAQSPRMTTRSVTGVHSKNHRGAQQALPGCLTKTTGVPSKNYRGLRQKLPGRLTRDAGVPDNPFRDTRCKRAGFLPRLPSSCIVLF